VEGVVTSRERKRRAATWLTLAASLGACLAFMALRVVTPSDGGRIAFYGDAYTAAGVLIDPIDAPQPELQPGDRVDAIAGRSLASWADLLFDPSIARPTGGTTDYLVDRDGAGQAIEVALAPPSLGSTLLEGWSVVLFSVALALVAAFVYARRPEVPAATALVLAACGAAGSSVPWFVGTTPSDIAQGWPFLLYALLTGGVYMVMWPAAVHLALVFPARAPIVVRRPSLVPAIYVMAFAAYGLLLVIGRATAGSTLAWIGTWPQAQLAIVVPCLLLWLVLAARAFITSRDPVARSRSRWAALGAATSAVLGLALFQVPELVTGQSVVPASWIGLIALPLPLGLAYGILHDRLFDIEVVLNRTLVYGTLTLTVILVYVVTVSILGTAVGPEHGYSSRSRSVTGCSGRSIG